MSRASSTLEQEEKGKVLGARIQARREFFKLKQTELAEKAQISVDTLRKIERGAVAGPSAFLIFKLSQILDENMENWLR